MAGMVKLMEVKMQIKFVIGGNDTKKALEQLREDTIFWADRLKSTAGNQAAGAKTIKESARYAGELYAYKTVIEFFQSIEFID